MQVGSSIESAPVLADEEKFAVIAQKIQKIFQQSQMDIKTIYALDTNGIVVRALPYSPEILGQNMFEYASIETRVLASSPVVSSMVRKPFTLSPEIMVSVPVIDASGEVAWVLACSIDVAELGINSFTQKIQIGQTGYVEIVDGNGLVFIRTNPGNPLNSFELSDHPTRFAELIASGQAVVGKCHVCHTPTQNTVPQQRDVIAFAPLETVPWGVAIRQSETEALKPTHQLEIRLGLLGSILVLSTLAVGIGMMQSIIKPIKILKNAADRVAANDYDLPIPVDRGDEIGQLSTAFQDMRNELKKSRSEMVSRYEEAKQREELRGQLLNSVIDAQEKERRRIARELHDEYGQTLTGLLMTIESVEPTLPPGQEKLRDRLVNTRSVVSRAIDEMRRLILDLRPPSLDELGLVTAVKTYTQRQLGDKDINVDVSIHGLNDRLPSALEVTIFRIIQEAVHNILKHAHARNVKIDLAEKEDKIVVVVEDDGQGFDLQTVMAGGSRAHSWGIVGIRERTELLGGTFKINSEKGKGTRFEVEIPLDERQWEEGAERFPNN